MTQRLRLISAFCILFLSAAIMPADALAAGKITNHKVNVGDRTREYMVYRPDSVPRSQSAKTVLAFHGFKSDPAGLRWLTKPDKWADKHKFLMIYPKAVSGSFNAGKGSGTTKSSVDDLAFVDAIIERGIDLHKIDPTRLYALGFSNGAQMAALTMCKRGRALAGIAMVAHSLNIPGCKPATPVPVAVLRGAKDPFVPFNGGGRSGLKSHENTISELLGFQNLAADNNEVSVDLPTIRCRNYPKARTSKLLACVGFEDGHTWPGGIKFQPDRFGTTNTDVSGYDLIFKFFDKQKAVLGTDTLTLREQRQRRELSNPGANVTAQTQDSPVAEIGEPTRNHLSIPIDDTQTQATERAEAEGVNQLFRRAVSITPAAEN